MRNNFLLLLILGITLFSACSDDDEKSKTYNGDQLTLSVSGVNLTGKEAVLGNGSLTLKNAIPGEPETVFVLTTVGEELQGINENTYRKLSLTGNNTNGKLTLKIDMKVTSPVVGKWDVKKQTGSVLIFNLTTSKENVIFGTDGGTYSPDMFELQMKHILVGPLLKNAIEYIIFEEDGNVTASIADNIQASKPNYNHSQKGIVLYNVVGDKIYIGYDFMKEIMGNLGRSTYDSIEQIQKMSDEGIPLEYNITNDILSVYMTRETMLPFLDFVPIVVKALPEDQQIYGVLLSQIATIIQESSACEVGLTMIPSKE